MNGITGHISEIRTQVTTYECFYNLAYEMANNAIHAESEGKAVKYVSATIVFSYMVLESITNYEFLSKNDSPFEKLSSAISSKIGKMTIVDKVELAAKLSNKEINLSRGSEPLQSLELLRELRNFLVHHMPTFEVTFHHEKDVEGIENKLAKKLKNKFEFNKELGNPFFYRCFSIGCAKWSIQVMENCLEMLSKEFSFYLGTIDRKSIDDT